MVNAIHCDALHVVARFKFATELWFGRLNPKHTGLHLPRAQLGRAIRRIDIAWQPSYFRYVSQFAYALARLPPGVRIFRRPQWAPPIVAPLSRNASISRR